MAVYAGGGENPPPPGSYDENGTAHIPPPRVRFGVISEAWGLFTQEKGAWVGAVALLGLVMLVPLCLVAYLNALSAPGSQALTPAEAAALDTQRQWVTLAGSIFVAAAAAAFTGGLTNMALNQVRGYAVAPGDLFSAFRWTGPLVVVLLVEPVGRALVTSALSGFTASYGYLSEVALLGAMLITLAIEFSIGALVMFAPLLIVDDRCPQPLAALGASVKAIKPQLLMGCLWYAALSCLLGVGFLFCLAGALVTIPVFFLSLALLYRDFFGDVLPAPEPSRNPNPWAMPQGR